MPGAGASSKNLLMAALHRAIALKQVDAFAELIAEDLNFNMARPDDVFFDQHMVVAKT